MLECILPVGIPGSGKSTWAREWVAEDKFNRCRVNNDDIRSMLNGGEYAKGYETMVGHMREALVKAAFAANKSVVIDNLNITPKHFKDAVKWARASGKEVCVFEKAFYCELDVAIERDSKREGSARVGEKVVRHWHKESGKDLFKHYHPKKEVITKQVITLVVQDDKLPRCVVFDNDGTISLIHSGRSPYDASTSDQDLPHPHVIECMRNYHKLGYKILFVSGREEKDREPTERFYAKHFPEVKYELYMRPTANQEKDWVIKERIFNEHIKPRYFVAGWYDDRLQVARWVHESGLPLFRVGDPEADF